jgi:hypothetical protein
MRILRRFIHDIGLLLRRRTTDDDLDEELDAFLKASVAHKMQSGMSREEATRTARLELGSALAVRDAVRDVGWTAIWETTWRDFRYGIRSLVRNGSFTLAAVTTLALGVGVTTAVFSIVNTVVLQPLPYHDSDRLVRIVERAAPRTAGGPLLRRTSMTWLEMAEWRTRSTTLSEVAYTLSPPVTLMSTPEGSARLSGALVSSNIFRYWAPTRCKGARSTLATKYLAPTPSSSAPEPGSGTFTATRASSAERSRSNLRHFKPDFWTVRL